MKDVIGAAGSPVLYLDAPEFEKCLQLDSLTMADVVRRIGRVD